MNQAWQVLRLAGLAELAEVVVDESSQRKFFEKFMEIHGDSCKFMEIHGKYIEIHGNDWKFIESTSEVPDLFWTVDSIQESTATAATTATTAATAVPVCKCLLLRYAPGTWELVWTRGCSWA